MAYNPLNPNGQAAMANSQPVVIASNQTPVSVAGTVGASIIGLTPVAITNIPSISGQVGASIIGTVPVTQSGPVITSISGIPQTSVHGVVSVAGGTISITPASVSGTVGASIIGLPPVKLSDGAEILGIYEENQADASIKGVAIMWKSDMDTSILSAVTPITPLPVSVQGVVRISGNPSISGTVNIAGNPSVSGQLGSSIIGQLPAGTAPLGSVAVLQGTSPWAIAGSVAAVQTGTWSASVMTNVISSIATAGQVMGSVATLQGTNPWIINPSNSSIITIQVGSVITVGKSSSILAVPVGSTIAVIRGSVAAAQIGTQIVSVVGTMAGTSSVFAVLSSITTVSIMTANVNRKAGTIYNAAGTTVFLKLGTAATTSVYTVSMNNGDYYELPGGWTGVVAGITTSNAGIINVTELT